MPDLLDPPRPARRPWGQRIPARLARYVRARFVGYSIVGALVLALGVSILTALVEVVRIDPIVAGAVSTFASIEVNFLLNWRINWRDRNVPFGRAWAAFHATRLVTVFGNQGLYTVLILAGTYYLLATAVTTSLAVVTNYFLNDRVVFRKVRDS